MTLFTAAFWRSIGWALLRTALAGLVPFLPGLLATPEQTWPVAGSTVALLLVVTVATSLRGLPDSGTAAWWEILLSRGLRQFGQFTAAGLVGAVVLADVDWAILLTGAAASALSTVILAALTLIPGDHAKAGPPVIINTITAEPIVDGRISATGLKKDAGL